MDNKITYAKYTLKGNDILKDGHTMFPQDIVTDLNRKSYLEEKNTKHKEELKDMCVKGLIHGLAYEDEGFNGR